VVEPADERRHSGARRAATARGSPDG